jgi:hypothetical protein
MGERFEPQILNSFDPVAQELYRKSPTKIHTQSKGRQNYHFLTSNMWNTWCSPARKTKTCNEETPVSYKSSTAARKTSCALGRRESQAESLVARQQREGLPRDSRNKTGSKGQPAQSHTNWTPGMRGDGGKQETKW